MKTSTWAKKLGVCPDETVPEVPGFSKRYARSTKEIAARCLILTGVIAVAEGCKAKPILNWFEEQGLAQHVSPDENRFFRARKRDERQCLKYQWHQEAEWTLLWLVRKVESLGLPTKQCDTGRIVDEIIPPLGGSVKKFMSSAKIRTAGEILAEDDRTYNLWCYVHQARRKEQSLPDDLNYSVLYERRYAFDWLNGYGEWDEIQCNA
jgi:Domain of unknown function (DUF4272)